MAQHRSSHLGSTFPVMALATVLAATATFGAPVAFAGSFASPYLTRFHTVGVFASTVPDNGDINPYGVAVVPQSSGMLKAGNVLVSNFNNNTNAQGTGSTIVQVTPSGTTGTPRLFAQIDATKPPADACPGGIGLTTALGVLQRGWVIVGSLPTTTTDGTATISGAGCLIVLDSNGQVVETFTDPNINGPWDMTLADGGSSATLYVTNVLNGTVDAGGGVVNGGTVVRITLSVPVQGDGMPSNFKVTVIGSGFPERTDPAALVIGPTGLALSGDGNTLYVADSLDNRIAALAANPSATSSPGTGQDVLVGRALNDPLGMTLVPNGDLVAVNGNDGKAVEVVPGSGKQAAVKVLDNTVTHGGKNGGGALFGLAPVPNSGGLYFVDDNTNTLNLLH